MTTTREQCVAFVGDKIARLVGAAPGQWWADSTSVNLYKLPRAALAITCADAPGRRVILAEYSNFRPIATSPSVIAPSELFYAPFTSLHAEGPGDVFPGDRQLNVVRRPALAPRLTRETFREQHYQLRQAGGTRTRSTIAELFHAGLSP